MSETSRETTICRLSLYDDLGQSTEYPYYYYEERARETELEREMRRCSVRYVRVWSTDVDRGARNRGCDQDSRSDPEKEDEKTGASH